MDKNFFYVFYDHKDRVICCGTAEQLVGEGYFPDKRAVFSKVSKLRAGTIKGKVVLLTNDYEN